MLYFLIGFMGSGKSYLCKQLSKELSIPCADMDKDIEKSEGMSINKIFAEHGEAYFREKERDYLRNLNSADTLIISTGGGAPCFFDNMQRMNEKGITIYLNRSKEVVISQLMKGIHKRPLLKGKSQKEVEEFYDFKMSERSPFYEQAKIHVGDLNYIEIAQMLKSGWL